MKIIGTINPYSINKEIVAAFKKYNVDIIRINGAHISYNDLFVLLKRIRKSFDYNYKLLLDIPGNKIRIVNLLEPIFLNKNREFFIFSDQLNYPQIINYIKKGDEILANDGLYKMKVVEVNENKMKIISHSEGQLTNGKGLHFQKRSVKDKNFNIPFIFEKDKLLLELSIKEKIDYIGVSYVRSIENIQEIKAIIKGNKKPIPIIKIETKEAYNNLEEIIKISDIINIDRGDLSSEIGIINLPAAQREIISIAKKYNKPIFLATQFFHYMVDHPIPLIAEIDAFYSVLEQKINGIQLSEETAIGKYTENILKIIRDLLKGMKNG